MIIILSFSEMNVSDIRHPFNESYLRFQIKAEKAAKIKAAKKKKKKGVRFNINPSTMTSV